MWTNWLSKSFAFKCWPLPPHDLVWKWPNYCCSTGQWSTLYSKTECIKKRPITLIVGWNCDVKHPCAILWLCEIDEVFNAKVHHLLYLHLIPFMDTLQQAVDLKDLQAILCYPAGHYGIRQELVDAKEKGNRTYAGTHANDQGQKQLCSFFFFFFF